MDGYAPCSDVLSARTIYVCVRVCACACACVLESVCLFTYQFLLRWRSTAANNLLCSSTDQTTPAPDCEMEGGDPV